MGLRVGLWVDLLRNHSQIASEWRGVRIPGMGRRIEERGVSSFWCIIKGRGTGRAGHSTLSGPATGPGAQWKSRIS